ncbi:MAG: hypothetical protein ABI663_23430, partial [Chryseolinea sp.]
KDAANDPMKRVELIEEIMNTVSLIPDHIKRTVYLQECSKKLDMPLSTLVIEVNKRLIKFREEKKHTESEKTFKEQSTPPQSVGRLHELSKSILLTPELMLKPFEREYIKVLINRGHMEMEVEEDSEVKNEFARQFDYLFQETQEVDFIDRINLEIQDFYRSEIAKGNIVGPDVFIRLMSDNLSKSVADLVVQKYFVSPGWKDNFIIIGDEYDSGSLRRVTLRWKLGFIQKMIVDNLAKLKLATIQEDIDGLLEIQSRVDEYKNLYAGALGIVVLPFSKIIEH